MFNATNLYEVRLTYLFGNGGRPKSEVLTVRAENGNIAICHAKNKFYDSLGCPIPDGHLKLDYICRADKRES